MRKIVMLFFAICLFAACKDNTKFVLKGNFKNTLKGSVVYLYAFKNMEMVPIDSTFLAINGDFKFERSSPNEELYRLMLENKYYMLTAQNGDELTFKADIMDINSTYELTGTKDAKNLMELNKIKNSANEKLNKIGEEFDTKVAAEPDKRAKLLEQFMPLYNKELDAMNKSILNFANENTNSIISFYAINLLNPTGNEAEMIAYADKIKGKFSSNQVVSAFVSRMDVLRKVQVGQTAPDFTIKSIDNKIIALKDFRGKYVLLDFWASWCKPCRDENPNVVKAFNQYKDKNFTVLGISLDKDVEAWKGAVKADGLTWQHGSDLNDFEGTTVRLYQIESIPASFLIDPTGKIVARNLRGEDLEKFLEKTLK